ncbi:Meprin A subunit beta [Chamberlinius hualienensis]
MRCLQSAVVPPLENVETNEIPEDYDSFYGFQEHKNIPLEDQKEGEPLNEIDFYNAKSVGLFEGDISGVNSSEVNFMGRNALRNSNYRWPNGIIPYAISNAFDSQARSLIARSLSEYHRQTCLRFVPRQNNQHDYVYIVQNRGCFSAVGRQGGQQQLSLGRGCLNFGIIIHELMHAVGFWHEQSRADRDNYVTIFWDNIQRGKFGMEYNFQKYTWSYIQALGEKYDLNSVMHYEMYSFTVSRNRPTIVPKVRGVEIGQRRGFSSADVRKINKLYGCEKPTTEEKPIIDETDGKCADNHNRCVEWAEKGECDKNPAWMRPNCMKACGVCDVGCTNLNTRCAEWSKKGECKTNPSYMKRFCKKACNAC